MHFFNFYRILKFGSDPEFANFDENFQKDMKIYGKKTRELENHDMVLKTCLGPKTDQKL